MYRFKILGSRLKRHKLPCEILLYTRAIPNRINNFKADEFFKSSFFLCFAVKIKLESNYSLKKVSY